MAAGRKILAPDRKTRVRRGTPRSRMMAIVTACCCVVSTSANAAAVDCAGTLSGVYTTKAGNVLVLSSWRGAWTQVCNLNSEWKGVPAQTCWGWFAKINTAVAQVLEVRFHFPDGTSAACDQYLTWENAPSPEYVMLLDP
ncbi:hypothetical protein SAMN02745824_3358 [Parasphingorhabdus marina DSM 22363]|uniref:Uncharacterized protein n=1 Tax=Parasphingorhabdus marina DSM 22363 TaxID=1123272 RepID=A0A1N6HM72_9SPHN|nr:hypothetical protein [Parasphingorhabdus marina]SIO20870.1 hypothetical protein SAMN02745824_3358 [Parasphingorhabdus marina DSM 22363]